MTYIRYILITYKGSSDKVKGTEALYQCRFEGFFNLGFNHNPLICYELWIVLWPWISNVTCIITCRFGAEEYIGQVCAQIGCSAYLYCDYSNFPDLTMVCNQGKCQHANSKVIAALNASFLSNICLLYID